MRTVCCGNSVNNWAHRPCLGLPSSIVRALLFLILLAGISAVWPSRAIASPAFAPLSRPEGPYEFLWQWDAYRDLHPPNSKPIEVNLEFVTTAVAVNPSVDLFLHLGGGHLAHGYYDYGFGSQTKSDENHLIGGGITKTLQRWKTEGSAFDNQTLIGAQAMGILPNEAEWAEVDFFVALKRRALAADKVWFHSITVGGSGTAISAKLSPSVSHTKNAVDYSKFQNAIFLQLGLFRFLGVDARLNFERPFPEQDDDAFSFVLAWSLPKGIGLQDKADLDIAKGSVLQPMITP